MQSDQDRLDLFRVYLDQIGRHPLLTKEDEMEAKAEHSISEAAEATTRFLNGS